MEWAARGREAGCDVRKDEREDGGKDRADEISFNGIGHGPRLTGMALHQ